MIEKIKRLVIFLLTSLVIYGMGMALLALVMVPLSIFITEGRLELVQSSGFYINVAKLWVFVSLFVGTFFWLKSELYDSKITNRYTATVIERLYYDFRKGHIYKVHLDSGAIINLSSSRTSYTNGQQVVVIQRGSGKDSYKFLFD